MVRHARWILVALMTFGVVGAAYACDQAKEASASNCTKSATVQTASTKVACTAAEKAACEAKKAEMAAAHQDCEYCQFVAELKKNQDKVTVSTIENDHGITLVFAAVNSQDVEAAQMVASKAYAMINAPAHCSYTRSEMAKGACDGCKEGIAAFANASVTFEDTETGATAQVEVKDKEQAQKLQSFFHKLNEGTKS